MGAVRDGADTVRGDRLMWGSLGCQGSVPCLGGLGEGGAKRKEANPGEEQGGGLNTVTQSSGTTLPPASAALGTPGRARPEARPRHGPAILPDPLGPVLTGHRPGGDGSGALPLRIPRGGRSFGLRRYSHRRQPRGPGPSGHHNPDARSPPPPALSGTSPSPCPRAPSRRAVGSALHSAGVHASGNA